MVVVQRDVSRALVEVDRGDDHMRDARWVRQEWEEGYRRPGGRVVGLGVED